MNKIKQQTLLVFAMIAISIIGNSIVLGIAALTMELLIMHNQPKN